MFLMLLITLVNTATAITIGNLTKGSGLFRLLIFTPPIAILFVTVGVVFALVMLFSGSNPEALKKYLKDRGYE